MKRGWKLVEVIAPVGYEFGVVDADADTVRIVVRPPGGEWPHGQDPVPDSINVIGPNKTRYSVRAAAGA